jgi:hypothetical protein
MRENTLPDFDCPPPSYVVMKDRGWLAIAKAVLGAEANYSKVVKNAQHVKRKEGEWRRKN